MAKLPVQESINGNFQFEAEVQWERLLTAKKKLGPKFAARYARELLATSPPRRPDHPQIASGGSVLHHFTAPLHCTSQQADSIYISQDGKHVTGELYAKLKGISAVQPTFHLDGS